jgi:predicted adenylyl cyclase CyaB
VEETEGKLLDVDAEAFLRKLKALDIPVFEVQQKDKIYIYGGAVFRIRDQDGRFYLAYKGPVKRLGGLKSREEIEVEVSSPFDAEKILQILGVNTSNPLVREKRVKKFLAGGARCELVYREGFIPYVEIEGTPRSIKEACEVLMVDFAKLVPFHPRDVQPI